MSKITDVYDGLQTKVGALLPAYVRMKDVHSIERNPDLILSQGYGVVIGQAINTNRNISDMATIEREFKVILTRRANALDTNAVGKASAEKQLFEDQVTLIKDIEHDPSLAGVAANAKFLSDSGINFLNSGNNARFLYVESIFQITYFEPLT